MLAPRGHFTMLAVSLLVISLTTLTAADEKSVKDFKRPFQVIADLIVDDNFFLLRELTPQEKASGIVNLDDPFNESRTLTTAGGPQQTNSFRPQPNDGLIISSLFSSPEKTDFSESKNFFRNSVDPPVDKPAKVSFVSSVDNNRPSSFSISKSRKAFRTKTPQFKLNTGAVGSLSKQTAKTNDSVSGRLNNPILITQSRRRRINPRTRKVQRIIRIIAKPFNASKSTNPLSASGPITSTITPLFEGTKLTSPISRGSQSTFRPFKGRRPPTALSGVDLNNPSQSSSSLSAAGIGRNNKAVRTGKVIENQQNVQSTDLPPKPHAKDDRKHLDTNVKRLMKRLPGGSETVLKTMPEKVFSCVGRPYGYYADMGTDCQVFHICTPVTYPDGFQENLRHSFFCNNGTIFDQETLSCREVQTAMPCRRAGEYYSAVKFFEKFNIFDRLREEHELKQQQDSGRLLLDGEEVVPELNA